MRAPLKARWMLLGVGGGVAAITYGAVRRARRRPRYAPSAVAEAFDVSDAAGDLAAADDPALDREPAAIPNSFDIDPADPVQGIDEVNEFHVEELEVDVMSAADVDNARAIAEAESALDEAALGLAPPSQTTLDDVDGAAHHLGDLYGAHAPPAFDLGIAFDEGQSWLEALEAIAVEDGAEPERELAELDDDEDASDPPHARERRDIPVADRGSGGRGGI